MEDKKIELKHGAGGEAMASMLKELILPHLKDQQPTEGDILLDRFDDAGITGGIALTTDTYTVRPIEFPGGNIGTVAFSGTVNDLSVMGVRPMALSSGHLIPAGFSMDTLKTIMSSMFELANRYNIPIIAGDTKVVEAQAADGLYINTAGVGTASPMLENNHHILEEYGQKRKSIWLSDSNVRDGDVIICSGYLGDHGIALMSQREGYNFSTNLKSDAQPLHQMIEKGLTVGGIASCKDPTRGGLANLLNEWREKSGVGFRIEETLLPVRDAVKSACELLGIDPLAIGNEGKAIFAVCPETAEDVLKALRSTPEGADAAIIGRASADEKYVVLETEVGGRRIMEAPVGDPVPRIC